MRKDIVFCKNEFVYRRGYDSVFFREYVFWVRGLSRYHRSVFFQFVERQQTFVVVLEHFRECIVHISVDTNRDLFVFVEMQRLE
jgi:hypothetical protein